MMQYLVSKECMFRGKEFVSFFLSHQEEYKLLVERHGIEKFDKVYAWLFKYMSGMNFGQWMVLNKVCPDKENEHLFFFCVEMIYESDLLSNYRFELIANSEGKEQECIKVIPPDEDKLKKLDSFYRHDSQGKPCGYNLIDWYGRLRRDPESEPILKFIFEVETEEYIEEYEQ